MLVTVVARFTATVVARFTAKTTNSEKAIYFLSLTYCSINKLPSKHFLVLKTPSTRLQRNKFLFSKTSWRSLQDVLEDEKLLCWRRLEDMYWRRLQDVISVTIFCLSRHLQDVLQIRLEDVLKMITGISVSNHGLLTNLNQYLTNLYLTNLYFTNLR